MVFFSPWSISTYLSIPNSFSILDKFYKIKESINNFKNKGILYLVNEELDNLS